MNALIVYAHHEPSSFAAAMLGTAVETLRAAGHTVTVSDLYAMGFDPISDRRNFRTVFDGSRLRQQTEEAHAAQVDGFDPTLHEEMRKLAECELLVFVFPIWWLGLPAILKGWVDRVFVAGFAYGGGRQFGNGVMRGKRAMCIVSTGGFSTAFRRLGAIRADRHRAVPGAPRNLRVHRVRGTATIRCLRSAPCHPGRAFTHARRAAQALRSDCSRARRKSSRRSD